MKFKHLSASVIVFCFYALPLNLFSQQTEVLKEIALSPSASLILKRIVEPVQGSPSDTQNSSNLFKPVKETYLVVFKSGATETEMTRSEFKAVSNLLDSSQPRFAVYDAVLDGGRLRYLFIDKGQILLAAAHVDDSGGISNYRQKALPEALTRIDTARFVKNKEGQLTLKIREPGKKAKDFQFNTAGEAVSAPADTSTTSPQ